MASVEHGGREPQHAAAATPATHALHEDAAPPHVPAAAHPVAIPGVVPDVLALLPWMDDLFDPHLAHHAAAPAHAPAHAPVAHAPAAHAPAAHAPVAGVPATPFSAVMAGMSAATAPATPATTAAPATPFSAVMAGMSATAAAPAHPATTAVPATPFSAAMAGMAAATAAPAHAEPTTTDPKEQIKHQVNDVKSVGIALQLATYSRGMTDATSKAFIQTLDTIDDPDLRHKVMAQFQAQTGQSLDGFIQHCNDWNNNGDNRDKAAALQLISKQRDDAETAIAKMSPEERAKKEDEAAKIAGEIAAATSKHDHGDENMQKIFRGLGGRTPEEIELIRAKVRDLTNGESNLYQKIDDGTHKGDEDEAVAMLAGDRVGSARAALTNEDDPKRLREVVSGLKPEELAQLRMGPFKDLALARIKNPADRAEIDALMNNNPAMANAERLGNLLKPKAEGMAKGMAAASDVIGQDNYDRRKPANVLKEFESMSGEDVKAAATAWNQSHPGQPSFEQMLETRWGDDDDKTERDRLLAMMRGDKGLDRSLRVQQGLREDEQDELEGGLAHDKVDAKALQSTNPEVRKKAEAIQAENASFERNNIAADAAKQRYFQIITGHANDAPIEGRSTKAQLVAHYEDKQQEDIGTDASERILGGDAAKEIHADRQKKHDDKVRDDRVGAMELLDDGKLSVETEFHRGKGTGEKAEKLENITNNEELTQAQRRYKEKYGKEMLPYSGDDRKDMNANELMIDNIRLYGVRAERPAQVEYTLEVEQYLKQRSDSLELDEAGEAGGGTQKLQRQILAAERKRLKGPQLEVHDPTVGHTMNGIPILVDNADDATIDDAEKRLPMKGEKVDDGLKDGVSKREFNQLDRGLVEANKAQEGAKKALANRIVKVLSTIAKIASALTLQPELIALIDVGEGALEMLVKHQVMGEAYDKTEDAKMLAFTAVADVALMGLSKVGVAKGAALVEQEALGVGEKTAMEMEHAVSGEAKAEALNEGAHAVAGESSALHDAIDEGASAEKALSSEAASTVGSRVEKKAADVAEGRALHEGESAAAKSVESEVGSEVGSEVESNALEAGASSVNHVPSEAVARQVQQLEKTWGLYGAGAKMAIQTVGGGIVQGRSPTDILKSLATGSLGLVLPAHLTEKIQGAIGSETAALKMLGEIAGFGTEVTTNAAINVAGGAEGDGALFDAFVGAAGSRVQRAWHGGGGGGTSENEQLTREPENNGPSEITSESTTPVTTDRVSDESKLVVATAPSSAAPSSPDSIAVHERLTEEVALPGNDLVTKQTALPTDERVTQQIAGATEPSASRVPAHERTTDRISAVEPQGTEEAAPNFVEDATGQLEAPHEPSHDLADQIDQVTGVDKGREYETFREEMKAFYANQEKEAANVTRVRGRHTDAAFDPRNNVAWESSYSAREFTYDNATLTQLGMDVFLSPESGIGADQVRDTRNNAYKGVDRIYNFGPEGHLHRLPNGNVVQFEPNFVDGSSGADVSVRISNASDPSTGDPRYTNMTNWVVDDVAPEANLSENTITHELSHVLGLPDEYVDARFRSREIATSTGVFSDQSIMGYYPQEGPNPQLKQRHLDQLGTSIGVATSAQEAVANPTPRMPRPASGSSSQAPDPVSTSPNAPAVDNWLTQQGVRPALGARSENREQYEARSRRQRAENAVARADQSLENPKPNAADAGHGHGRHGNQTTDIQQAERVVTGRYPDDPPTGPLPPGQNPARRASRFGSPEAEAEALARGRADLNAQLAAQSAANGGTPPPYSDPVSRVPMRIRSVVETSRPEGFGSSQVALTGPDGQPTLDGSGNRVSVADPSRLGHARIVWEYVRSIDEWRPVTYFPEP